MSWVVAVPPTFKVRNTATSLRRLSCLNNCVVDLKQRCKVILIDRVNDAVAVRVPGKHRLEVLDCIALLRPSSAIWQAYRNRLSHETSSNRVKIAG